MGSITAGPTDVLYQSRCPDFCVRVNPAPQAEGRYVLAFAGSMCTVAMPDAAKAMASWLGEARPSAIEIDLGAVEFIDGRGVSWLVAMRRRADHLGIGWTVVDVDDWVQHILGICGLLDRLDIAAERH